MFDLILLPFRLLFTLLGTILQVAFGMIGGIFRILFGFIGFVTSLGWIFVIIILIYLVWRVAKK